jgi:hypothetical protein
MSTTIDPAYCKLLGEMAGEDVSLRHSLSVTGLRQLLRMCSTTSYIRYFPIVAQ